MRLIVQPIYTEVEGDFIENQTISELLTAPDEDGDERTLYNDNRFYTGLLGRVEEVLKSRSIEYELVWAHDPERRDPKSIDIPLDYLPGIEVRPHQLSSSVKLISRGRGGVNVATGGGKTEIGVITSKYFDTQTVIVCPYINAMAQTAARFNKYGLDCGRLGGGFHEIDKQFVSAVAGTLYSGARRYDSDIIDLLHRTRYLLLDEVHHLSCDTWTAIGEQCPAVHRGGLSASFFNSIEERFYDDLLLVGQTGEIVSYVPPRWLIDKGYLAEPLIHWQPINTARINVYDWHKVYAAGVVNNMYRNLLTAAYARFFLRQGMKILILVQRHGHGKLLLSYLRDPRALFSIGGGNVFRWDEGLGKCTESSEDPETIRSTFDAQDAGILIGTQVYDECIDIPSMNALIVAGGGKRLRRIIQRIGRAMHSAGEVVHVIEFWDFQHPFLQKHSRERSGIYKYLEYKEYEGAAELNKHLRAPFELEEEMRSLFKDLDLQNDPLVPVV